METINKITFEVFTLTLRKDGILNVDISAEKEYTVDNLKELMPIMGQFLNYKKVPMLITRDESVLPTLETRNYWAKKDSCPYSLAEAFIMKTLALKLIGNFYLKVNKPGRTTRIFSSEEDAVKWLKSFL